MKGKTVSHSMVPQTTMLFTKWNSVLIPVGVGAGIGEPASTAEEPPLRHHGGRVKHGCRLGS
jgi:hypothetical protein